MPNAAHVRYLLTLKRMNKNHGIRSADVADELNVTKTSVHNMMEKFIKMDYVEKENGGLIFVTKLGLQMAEYYDRQYRKIRHLLFADHEADKSVERAICALIADLSDESRALLMQEQTA